MTRKGFLATLMAALMPKPKVQESSKALTLELFRAPFKFHGVGSKLHSDYLESKIAARFVI